jgi:hypothetical protein
MDGDAWAVSDAHGADTKTAAHRREGRSVRRMVGEAVSDGQGTVGVGGRGGGAAQHREVAAPTGRGASEAPPDVA